MALGIGIIGTGMVGQMCHLANLVGNPACQVVAVADLRPELATAAATKFGISRVYRTHRELLADDDISAVVVVTRRRATGPIVLDALTRGRHVLSEKPMAYTSIQARTLVDVAQRQQRIYSIGYMKRHDAGVARAVETLRTLRIERSLGPIHSARAWCLGGNTGGWQDRYVMTTEPRPDGLELWDDGPGWMPAALRSGYDTFLNVFSHVINLGRHLLGPSPDLLRANISAAGTGTIVLGFGDVPCTLEFSNANSGAWREGLTVNFERGSVTVDLPAPFMEEEARVIVDQDGRGSELPRGQSWSFRRQADAFVADVVNGRRPLAPGSDSVTDVALAEAIWKLQA